MCFTYAECVQMLNLLKEKGYKITNYHNWNSCDRCVVFRHDVDFDMDQAFSMAQLEYEQGIESTYFVLLTSNFYNLFSKRNRDILNKIQDMGHTIGLHFDEMAYPEDAGNLDKIVPNIRKEISILSEAIQKDVTVFSYHRPTKTILDADIKIEGAVNSYGNLFFRQFKYLSDSRRCWREPVMDIIQGMEYERLHILTHPFWYHDEDRCIKEALYYFIKKAHMERYDELNENFTKLDEIIGREE